MQKSPLRHPLAVLRQIIGLSQQEMADLVGKSRRTIQSIELGTLQLGEDLANSISLETGVSLHWLLDGDPLAPIVDIMEHDYTLGTFQDQRAHLARPPSALGHALAQLMQSFKYYLRIRRILNAATELRKSNLAMYRLDKALQAIATENGVAEELEGGLSDNVLDFVSKDVETQRRFLQLANSHRDPSANVTPGISAFIAEVEANLQTVPLRPSPGWYDRSPEAAEVRREMREDDIQRLKKKPRT